jgi:outer membrane protein, multidrug efflux system
VKFFVAVAVLLSLIASCVPNTPTQPPGAQLPAEYRGTGGETTISLGASPWRKLYDDPVLQALIAKALQKNYTVQQAYAAVLVAKANLDLVAGNQQPQVGATVQAPYQVNAGEISRLTPTTEFGPNASLSASYQIDLFGKLASATSTARAQLFATQAAGNVVYATLVSQVASAYFQLLELDSIKSITENTAAARKENVRLTQLRVDYCDVSIQDLLQAQQALYETTEQLPLILQSIAQTEDALSALTGEYPHAIARGLSLEKQIAMPDLPPAGVPSELLTRRPDVVQAEYTLAAADANIDVARKELYPSLSLGATASVSGSIVNGINLPAILAPVAGINNVFYGPQGLFALVPQLTQAIFSGGRLQANVRLTQAQQQEAVASYLQTVLTAFTEVADDIAAYDQQRAYRVQVGLYEAASTKSLKVANERYEAGETSYLEVLNAETRSYQADANLQQAKLSERLALVQLYLALGGGWQT